MTEHQRSWHVDAQAFINTARKIYEKIEQGVFDVSNEVRLAGLSYHSISCNCQPSMHPLVACSVLSMQSHSMASSHAVRLPVQSYGIKVGYGAGGSAGGTVRPGEPAPAKSSSCC